MADRRPARVLIDGPPWSGLPLGTVVVEEVHRRGREAWLISADDFLRPASVRYERGRDDPEAFAEDWVDVEALRREVLAPLDVGGSGRILPTLWDPVADRATRAAYLHVGERAVVICSGWMLLGHGLPAELTVHLQLSAAARARRVPPADATRELPAYDRYDTEVRPDENADLVVRADDPRHPALIDRRLPGSH